MLLETDMRITAPDIGSGLKMRLCWISRLPSLCSVVSADPLNFAWPIYWDCKDISTYVHSDIL